MKTLTEHIHHIHGKPHHIRRQIALSLSAAVTIGIALIWLVGNVALGTFAIAGSSFADSVSREQGLTAAPSAPALPAFAGAAAALSPTEVTAHIEIVDTTTSASKQKKAEQTIIPF